GADHVEQGDVRGGVRRQRQAQRVVVVVEAGVLHLDRDVRVRLLERGDQALGQSGVLRGGEGERDVAGGDGGRHGGRLRRGRGCSVRRAGGRQQQTRGGRGMDQGTAGGTDLRHGAAPDWENKGKPSPGEERGGHLRS